MSEPPKPVSGTLFDGLSAQGRPARLWMEDDRLVVEIGPSRETLSPSQWVCEEALADGFFRLRLDGEWKGVLEAKDPELGHKLGAKKGGRRRTRRGFFLHLTLWLLAAAAGFALLYIFALPLAAQAVTARLPRKVDDALGAAAMRQLPWDTLSPRPRLDTALHASRAFLDALGQSRGLRFRLHWMKDTSLANAFALPSGDVLLFPALVRRMESPDELWGVLAHEAGHVALRHGTRRLVRASILGIVSAFTLGDVTGAGTVLLDNAGLLAQLGYSREEEAEADRFALQALADRGLNCRGLETFFEKPLGDIPAWAGLLSTHPSNAERISALAKAREAIPACAEKPRAALDSSDWKVLRGRSGPKP